ncbi:BZ3500_MvSof-1268-A1-R1_Chr7-1g09101 [Microbotryum saponariae]|uniref:BZ3500_MvSof-1268-A1-R1_Chr7-1g09101 protein n=1 Tax=Microbotryum saponariae TaxID=289078 RepID=A0A2X0M1F9_9BASI|nr:BZ3501_MvSof-1269-A2-R1_Chr7-1g08806 [Microbotryum saponariae]SDA02805.1 BZ3500_MvSof-1268-A1-R1_Chr7-1g09101 [Microbotryum saponariae]
MSNRTRPIIKRQYGSSNKSSRPDMPSSSGVASSSSPSSSSAVFNHSVKRARSGLMTSDNEDDGPSVVSTPPSSSSPVKPLDKAQTRRSPRANDVAHRLFKENASPVQALTSTMKSVPAPRSKPSGDLRSFFVKLSPKRVKLSEPTPTLLSTKAGPSKSATKRAHGSLFGIIRPTEASNETSKEIEQSTSTLASLPSSSLSPEAAPSSLKALSSNASSSSSNKPKTELEQLYLDPFTTAGHSTLSCAECGLSYARTPDDMALHEKHHKKVVGGVDWVAASCHVPLLLNGIMIILDHDTEFTCAMIDPASVKSTKPAGKKIREILATIDAELGATALTPKQLRQDCKLVFVTTAEGNSKHKNKVVAACLVQRIKKAHQIVVPEGEDQGRAPVKDGRRTIEFSAGDDQGGAVFCDPNPVPTLLGIHRIWTCSTYRRKGLGTKMLDLIAARCIYGAPISQERRRLDVAFSQPTGKGHALAARWTGTKAFRVFVE